MQSLQGIRKDYEFVGSIEEFKAEHMRKCVLDGNVYYAAPEHILQAELNRLAHNRKVAQVPVTSISTSWTRFYPAGAQLRLKEAMTRFAKETLICDLDQNPGFGPAAGARFVCNCQWQYDTVCAELRLVLGYFQLSAWG